MGNYKSVMGNCKSVMGFFRSVLQEEGPGVKIGNSSFFGGGAGKGAPFRPFLAMSCP